MVTLLNTVEDSFAKQVCTDHGNKPDEVIEILHAVQAKHGYVSDGALRTIANAVNISRADIHGIISFYHDFKRKPQAAKTIKICRAEACQAVGVEGLIAEAEAEFDVKLDGGGKDIALEAAYCLGNCALGPAVLVGDDLYGRVNMDTLRSIYGETSV